MRTHTQVEGHKDLVRDEHSGAILNTNKTAYMLAMSAHDENHRRKLEMKDTQKDINNIKSEVKEIKDMLMSLLEQGVNDGR